MDISGTFIINIGEIIHNSKIAAFDLDHTLIKPKSGNKFPRNEDDWVIITNVKEKLNELYKLGYKIVIFTNQGSSSFNLENFKIKMNNIVKILDVPIQLFGSTENGYYRKPSIGMYKLLETNNNSIEIDKLNSFYCGDAYSTLYSFNDSDLKFALNIGFKFYKDINMIDEEFVVPIHPLRKTQMINKEITPSEKQEMIILVGPPACGKSTFSLKFKKYVIISQDILKTKQRVIKTTIDNIKNGLSIIIDKKNEYIKDRKEFIDIAKKFNISVRIVWFNVDREIVEHLNNYRYIMTNKYIPSIVYNKYYGKNGLEIPTIQEGVDDICIMYFNTDLTTIENKTICFSYLV